ncbi:carbohydrate-binding module family 50 protein [Hydnomerulius pinastri MD-312]|uniref:Carbohydrate-binding module family 50 protein n=1 Tax=Hydnomerulius pinastri MD-312 TaxID=994086 RepID=A0A0C9WBL6_9AGAM|nr:carbohydrate-binding module family 50 protein [Hydnomerulius pinastri MD-312]
MLELDEWDELLTNNFTTNPFASESNAEPNVWDSVVVESNNNTPLVIVTGHSSDQHPLRRRSSNAATSSAHFSTGTVTITPPVTLTDATEGETRPRLTRLLSGLSDADGPTPATGSPSDATTAGDQSASESASDTIIHRVNPVDSFAGVALRYGVSIAALRRANQLWPSDPIHLRTELIIPRGDTFRARSKTPSGREAPIVSESDVELPSQSSSSDVLASTFGAARSAILSALPARMSLDSLSSRTSASEDHELEVIRKGRPPDTISNEAHDTHSIGNHELAILTTPYLHRSTLPPLPHLPCTPVDDHFYSGPNNAAPTSDSHSSSAIPRDRPHRPQPSVFVPVRTSQLEPEPAMELPARRPSRG